MSTATLQIEKKKPSVPQLRFSRFEGNWELKKFGELATNKSGKFNPVKENFFTKCIELEHLGTETGQLLGFIDGRNSGSIKNKFNEGDVLFGKLRPYLKKYLQAPFEGVCSSEIWVLKGLKITNSFLYQIVQTNKFIDLANQSSGSKMPRADWNVVENGVFSFPTLDEQQKIASFLSAVDEKIQQLSRKKELLEQYKKGIMQQLFSGKLRFKDENGKDYPEWEEKKLGEVAEKIGDGLHGTPMYSDDSDIYFINGNNLTNGKIEITEKTKKVDYNIFTKNDKRLNTNTILISLNGTIGNISKYNNEKVMLGKSVGYFNFKENADFYFHILKTETIQNFFTSELTGSTIKNLSLKTLRETEISVPCSEEQQKIANFLSSIDGKIKSTNNQITQTQSFKKGLLQQLFV